MNYRRPSKKTKNKENGTDDEEEEEEEESNSSDDLDDDQENKEAKKKKIYYGRKRKPTDEELIEDPTELSSIPLEPLAKEKRQPAQERTYKELNSINQRIATLVQVRQMGLSTPENHKQLKELMRDRKKKAFEIKRLQSRQRASNKYRVKKRKIVKDLFYLLDISILLLLLLIRLNIYLKQNLIYIHN
jgi:hypothetical protein